jgi:signal peptidase II
MIWIVICAVIAADLISKHMIAASGITDIVLIPGFFHFTYAENTGMAWSLLSGQTGLLALISAVAIGVMLRYLLVNKPDKLTSFALALMIGGAAGNLYDRLFLGYVRDFLNFYIFGYDFPVFNIADAALCIGVFLLVIASFTEDRKHG